MSEATQVLEGLKSLTAEEPPALDVQAIADAAMKRVIETLAAQPPAEPEPRPDVDADEERNLFRASCGTLNETVDAVVTEKPTTAVSTSETPVIPDLRVLSVRRGDGAITLSAEVCSLLRASLKANLQDVTNKILWAMLED